MKTEQLYEFLVLSRTLNYSRAADALYIRSEERRVGKECT